MLHLQCSILFISFLGLSSAFRILVVFPTPSISHQRPQIALSKALAAHGHHVTILSPDPFETINPNIRQINLNFLYKDKLKAMQSLQEKQFQLHDVIQKLKQNYPDFLLNMFSNEETKKLLGSDERFDAVLVEYTFYPATHALAEKYNATLIGLISYEMGPWHHRGLGNPTHPILHPLVNKPISDEPSLFEKIQILVEFFLSECLVDNFFHEQESLIRQFVPENKLSISQLVTDRIDLAIESISPMEGYVRPILPNTKQIGFLHIEPPNPLPRDLQEYMDDSRGIVYVSFGSNVRCVDFRQHFLQILQSAFERLPFNVLWKYESDTMPNKPKNVKTIVWSPQMDLLAHPKVKLFVTQGGTQSLQEAMSRGVPVLVIPFFGDQEYNAARIEKIGMGRKLLKSEITEESLHAAVMEVIGNTKYKKKVTELGNQIQDTPMNATETAVWYIEHAIRNRGAEMFKYRARLMSNFEYYFLDVALFVLMVFTIACLILLKICLRIQRIFTKSKKD